MLYALHHRRVFEAEIRRSRQRSSRGLTTRQNQQSSIRINILARHAAWVIILKDMFHEIRSISLPLYTLIDLLFRPGMIPHCHFLDLWGKEPGNDGVHGREVMEHGENLGEFDPLEDGGDPGVVVTFFETVEGVAEAEVAEDVEGGVVVPVADVD